MTAAEALATRAVRYQLEIGIEASADRVWRALTEETGAWWLPAFHVAGAGSKIALDARPGGHLIERTDDGGGVLWCTVHACVPRRSMTLVGPLSADCGPATTMLTLTLEDQGNGWTLLLGEGLKRHAEAHG